MGLFIEGENRNWFLRKMLWANKHSMEFRSECCRCVSTNSQISTKWFKDHNARLYKLFLHSENRYFSSQYFRSSYFSHFFPLPLFFPHFSPFPPLLPPFFTDRSFAPREGQRSLAQEILIFRDAGRILVNNRYGFRTVFGCENERFKSCATDVQWLTNPRRDVIIRRFEATSRRRSWIVTRSFTRWTSLAISFQRIWSFLTKL